MESAGNLKEIKINPTSYIIILIIIFKTNIKEYEFNVCYNVVGLVVIFISDNLELVVKLGILKDKKKFTE